MYFSDSAAVTLTGIQAPKLARTPSISPVPATCHLRHAIPFCRSSANIHIFMTLPGSVSKDYQARLFPQPAL